MEGRLLARARAQLETRRQRGAAEADRRRTEIYQKIPRVQTIDARLRAIMSELVGLALGLTARSGEEMAEESLALQAERAGLLRAAGYPEDYLDERFACPLCRDKGTLPDGRMCECLLTLYKAEQTRELSPLLHQGEQTFETFRMDYYSAQPLSEGQPAPRRQMERIFSTCRLFAERFGQNSDNMLFTGAPGLGKTFLSAAIARVVADQGFSVAYDTAAGLLAAFEREKFSRDEDVQSDAASRARQLMSCDLLILDDLGTEMSTSFTLSALYTLLDGRLRSGRKTIISTNLDRAALTERYGPQLASRLFGEYQWLTFLGRDIRAMKKESV